MISWSVRLRRRQFLAFALLLIGPIKLFGPMGLSAGDANRLAYVNDFCNPYYAHRTFPKLVTAQWVGEQGVQAVVTLGIDDMRDTEKYETYLRPIFDRLKAIDGRAAVSVMTCQIDPAHPRLQQWLAEGVSIETHTADHPCPCLQGGNFDRAKSTYDRCVDQISEIPHHQPVAFRFPCCDSQNTPSPRAFAEIIHRTTPDGHFLQLSSSVSALLTADDPELPRELVLADDGKPRFTRYSPFPSFVNKVENYPYPFVIDHLCWEFPISAPDDWQGFNLQGANNPQTIADMKAMIDATVIKRGVANLVFHPHGWIRSDQMVDVIDHVAERHGPKVKFLNFGECIDRLNQHLLSGQSLRDARGGDNGVRLLDVNADGYLDVVIGNEHLQRTRIWMPGQQTWKETDFPARIVDLDQDGRHIDAGVQFGVMTERGTATVMVRNEHAAGVWHFDGDRWIEDEQGLSGLSIDQQPIFTARGGIDQGVRMRDLDRDGGCELVVGNSSQNAVFDWSADTESWLRLPFSLPAGAMVVDANGHDQGLRFVDVDEDGHDDVLFSNELRFGLHLYRSLEDGWDREIQSGDRGDADAIPMISRLGTNNGAWFAARHLWVQNEDTHRLSDGVDRRSFADLLGQQPAPPKTTDAALNSIEVAEGLEVKLVAAEPLVADPVAMDWGPDGRLWVVEMADYPLGVNGQGKPGGRVRFLEDTDDDGTYDRSTLFLENVSTPTGILVWRDGVLITAAPDVLYAEDTDGDGKADQVDKLFSGFGEGNQQHRVNGFAWGLDNWVYLANGDSGGVVGSKRTGNQIDIRGRDLRIRPDEGLIEPIAGQSQFGRHRDDWGNWFGSNNPNPIFHYVLDDGYLQRNPHFSPPASRKDIREGSSLVFPISPNISHCDTRYRPINAPSIFTSCNSTIVYRDDLFGPAFSNSTFTSEPVYNVIHRRTLVPDGVTFRSVKPEGELTTEFFRSSDAWSRPTSLRVGPDGALYVSDMVREVIEHPEWIDDELEKQIDVRAGHDRGRIYRIAPVGVDRRPVARLDRLSTIDLVAALDSPSGWQRDMVHRMLLWRADDDAIKPLEDLVVNSRDSRTRLQALCVLDGLDAVSDSILSLAVEDADPRVRPHAIRILDSMRANSEEDQARMGLDSLWNQTDRSPPMQLQLAYSAGQWAGDPEAGRFLGRILTEHADDPYRTAAAMSSLNPDNIEQVLVSVLQESDAEQLSRKRNGQLLAVAISFGKHDVVSRAFDSLSKPSSQTPASNAPESNPPNGNSRASDRFSVEQLSLLADLLTAAESRQKSIDEILTAPLRGRVSEMLAQARATANNPSAESAHRAVAIRLLGRDAKHEESDLQRLLTLLGPRSIPDLQQAALGAFARLSAPQVPDLLIADWSQFSPTVRAGVLDQLLGRTESTLRLVKALESGQVLPAQMDAARRDRLLNHKRSEIRQRAQRLFSQPTRTDRKEVIERYRDALDLTADAARGKQVFEKRCAGCHQLDGIGHQVGPSLLAIKDRSPQALLVALLDPNRAVEDKYLAYAVLTIDGRLLTGVIVEESGNQISLKDSNGKQHDILRDQIDELHSMSRSLMPEGLENDISKQNLADLLKFVSEVGGVPSP